MSPELTQPDLQPPQPDMDNWLEGIDLDSLGEVVAIGDQILAEHQAGVSEPDNDLDDVVEPGIIAEVVPLDDLGERPAAIETPTAEYLGALVFRTLAPHEERIVNRADATDVRAGRLLAEGRREEARTAFRELNAWAAEQAYAAAQQARRAAEVAPLTTDDDNVISLEERRKRRTTKANTAKAEPKAKRPDTSYLRNLPLAG